MVPGRSLFSGTYSSHGGVVTSSRAANLAGGPGSVYIKIGDNDDNFVESLVVDNTGGQQVWCWCRSKVKMMILCGNTSYELQLMTAVAVDELLL